MKWLFHMHRHKVLSNLFCVETVGMEQKQYYFLTFVSFHSGTQISDQQKELWTEVVSNKVDMLWSPKPKRELSIYLNEDQPAARNTCSRYQYQDKHGLPAEIVTDMAAWNVSTARVAAATVNPYNVKSSTNTFIHQNVYGEEKKEAASGISGIIRDGGDSSSTCCGNAWRVLPGQPLPKLPTIARTNTEYKLHTCIAQTSSTHIHISARSHIQLWKLSGHNLGA